MKRHVQNAGTKKWFGDYLVELESEPLKAIDKMASAYDGCMITGGLLTLVSGTTYNVSAGLVSLKIDGEYKVAPLPATSNVDVSVQKAIRIVKTAVTGQYQIPVDLTIAYNYTAEVINYVAGLGTLNQDYLLIPTNGGAIRSYRDAIQSSLYRFVTDTEKNTWNSKAAGTHTHAATDITQTASYRFVTDAEKSTWNGKVDAANPVTTKGIILDAASHAFIQFKNNGTDLFIVGSDSVIGGGAVGEVGMHVYGANPLQFWTNGERRMILGANGNFGVGTITPALKTHINGVTSGLPATSGTTQTGGILRLQNSGSNAILDVGGYGGDGFWLQTTNSANLGSYYSLLLNPRGGYVGIGTVAPEAVLHVQNGVPLGSAAGNYLLHTAVSAITNNNLYKKEWTYREASGEDWTTAAWIDGFDIDHAFSVPMTNAKAWYKRKPYSTEFMHSWGTAATTFMGLTTDGKMGIGTTNPAQALDVTGNIAASGSITGASLSLTGNATISGSISATKGVAPSATYHGTYTDGQIYSYLSSKLPNIGDKMIVYGGCYISSSFYTFSYATRNSSTQISIYSAYPTGVGIVYATSGGSTSGSWSIAW